MNIQNMAPNAKKSLVVSALFGLVAAGVYFGMVEPAIAERESTAKKLAELQDKSSLMARNLAGADKLKARLADVNEKLAPYREAMLKPLLESLAMRAKSFLDPIALGAELDNVEYEELSPLALPTPPRLPVQLHARQPIKVTANGSYQAAISFLLRVEKQFPLVNLESLTISALNEPDAQRIEMIFEWPVKGKVTRVVPQNNGGKK